MLDHNALTSGATTGWASEDSIGELQKALTIGYGTDSSSMSGGRALQVQSLDATMQATIQENSHFTLFNKLAKPRVGGTVDEWTEQSAIGGFPGGSTNTETGDITESTGQYDRRVGLVKFLSTRRQVSLVSTITNNIADAEAVEQRNGALQLMTDANYLCYTGDSSVVPTEFDGLEAQIRGGVLSGRVPADHIVDLKGSALTSIDAFARAGAAVSAYESYGTPTDLFWPNSVQADVDAALDPAFRVSLSGQGNDITLGAPVSAIRLSQGVVKTNYDVFIPDDRMTAPFQVKYGAIATSNAAFTPASVTPGSPVSDVSSSWLSTHAGNYYYAVAGVTAKGQSPVVVSSQVAIATGQRVTLTITASAGGTETGYAIYRSRKNGGNAVSDMRMICRIPKAGATTTFTDLNALIPGTTHAFMLNMRKADTAIMWRQLLPMFKFALYPTSSAVVPWAQLLFGFLRISKLRHHAMIDNILPNSAQWRPFG